VEIKLLYARTATEGQYGSTWDGEEKEKSRERSELKSDCDENALNLKSAIFC